MRNVHLFSIVFLHCCFCWSQKEVIAQHGFEVSGSSWGSPAYSVPPCNSEGDVWNIVDSLGEIKPFEGNHFWGIQDLNGDCGSNGFEWIELPGVDISGFRSVTCRIHVQVNGFDSGDDMELEPWFNGVAQERIVLIDGISDFSTDGWIEAKIDVPDAVAEFGLRIYVKQNGSDQAGIDDVRLEGVPLIPCSELFISEYVEGTSSTTHRNNFIEIYNPSSELISLNAYELVKYTGSNTESSTPLSLEGEIGPYQTFLIEDQNENLGIDANLSSSSTVMDFNGDDKIALRKNGFLIDLIGIIGDSLNFARDQVLRRKSHIRNSATPYNPDEWDLYGLEQTTDLGRHQSFCSGPGAEIKVFGNNLEVPDGKSSTEYSDNTYFGYLDVGNSNQIENEFLIVNHGTSSLDLTSIELVGEHKSDFSLEPFDLTPLLPGESLTLRISFSPTAHGIRNAFLRIENNDTSEPNHEFLLQGEGASYTSSPLMITTYYEGEGNNRWIELTNISAHQTPGNTYFLALYRQNLLNGPIGKRPSVKRAIPALEPGEVLKFRASLNVTLPVYALDGNEISTNVCGFNGDDVLVISTTDDETCWEKRVDVIGTNGPWGQDIAYVRKFGCEQENPHSGFNPEHWYPFGPDEIDNAESGSPQRLGEYYRGETRFRQNAWTNGRPSLYRKAILEDDYNTLMSGNLRACRLEILPGANLTVAAGDHIVVQHDLEINGSMDVINEGELLMIENSGLVKGQGEIRIHRSSSELYPLDYTYWSSPVESANLGSTFPDSNPNHIYSFSAPLYSDENSDGHDDNGDAWVLEHGNMTPGKGYAILAPEPLPIDKRQKVVFYGKPNNGPLEIPIMLKGSQNSGEDWNLIGNPYPCTLNAEALIEDQHNAGLLSGALYFWTHNTPLEFDEDSGQKQYSSSDYAIYSIGLGGVQASSGGPTPDGNIAVGQSFFTEALKKGKLRFTNEMRRVGLPSHFFKPSPSPVTKTAKKIWLNLRNQKGAFSQILIGFKKGATQGYDPYFDAKRLMTNSRIEFYSKVGPKKLAIRGEPLVIGEENIPLGIEIKSDEIHFLEIEIDHLSDSFENTGIYLLDLEKNIIHNLKKGPYAFEVTEALIEEERFVLRFTEQDFEEISSNEDLQIDSKMPDGIIWTLKNEVLEVRTRSNSEIVDLRLFDMLGRSLVSLRPGARAARVDRLNLAHNTVYFLQLKTKNSTILATQILHI